MSTNFQIFPAVETALSCAELLAAMHPLFRAEVRERMPRRGVQISFAPQVLHHDPAHAGTRANRGEYLSKDATRSTSLRMDGGGAWDTFPQRCLELGREHWEEARRNCKRERGV